MEGFLGIVRGVARSSFREALAEACHDREGAVDLGLESRTVLRGASREGRLRNTGPVSRLLAEDGSSKRYG